MEKGGGREIRWGGSSSSAVTSGGILLMTNLMEPHFRSTVHLTTPVWTFLPLLFCSLSPSLSGFYSNYVCLKETWSSCPVTVLTLIKTIFSPLFPSSARASANTLRSTLNNPNGEGESAPVNLARDKCGSKEMKGGSSATSGDFQIRLKACKWIQSVSWEEADISFSAIPDTTSGSFKTPEQGGEGGLADERFWRMKLKGYSWGWIYQELTYLELMFSLTFCISINGYKDSKLLQWVIVAEEIGAGGSVYSC